MSKMKSDRRPPLARSPVRLRPRQPLRSSVTLNTPQTPPGSLMKARTPIRTSNAEESELRPEYRSISCELQALAKMVHEECGNYSDLGFVAKKLGGVSSPPFVRGRFYEEYAARRNERLRKRKAERVDERKAPYGLGVTVESAKRRGDPKQSVRRSMPVSFSVDRRENPTPRYSLRSSSKANKKPPPPPTTTLGALDLGDYSEIGGKTRGRRGRKI